MNEWVVTVGFTRRLVKANDAEKAIDVFLSDAVMRRALAGARDACQVRPATATDIADFKRGKPKPGPDQLGLTLDDVRKTTAATKKRSKERT